MKELKTRYKIGEVREYVNGQQDCYIELVELNVSDDMSDEEYERLVSEQQAFALYETRQLYFTPSNGSRFKPGQIIEITIRQLG